MRNLIYILIMVLLFSCTKDDTFSVVPTIEFKSITPSIAQEYIDDINILDTDDDALKLLLHPSCPEWYGGILLLLNIDKDKSFNLI